MKAPRSREVLVATQPQEVEVAPDRSQCSVHYSHLSFGDFGRTGCLEHWKITKIFEAGARFAMSTEILNFDPLFNEGHYIFVSGIQYKILPQLWSVQMTSVFPYKVSTQVTERGRTSLTTSFELVNQLDNQTLATAEGKVVLIDRNTRRPSPFPDWYLQKYAAVPMPRKTLPLSLACTRLLEIPPAAYCQRREVGASDTDFNGHTNHCSYVRFCSDAAQAALRAGSLGAFQQDVARYPLKDLEVVCFGESEAGDWLGVYVWQPADQADKILFVIHKHTADNKQPSLISQAYMVFQMQQLPMPQSARL